MIKRNIFIEKVHLLNEKTGMASCGEKNMKVGSPQLDMVTCQKCLRNAIVLIKSDLSIVS